MWDFLASITMSSVNFKLYNPGWLFIPVLNSCHPVSAAGVKSTEKFTAPYPAALPYIVWILFTNPTIAVLCAKMVRDFTHATPHVHVCSIQRHNVLTNTCICVTCICQDLFVFWESCKVVFWGSIMKFHWWCVEPSPLVFDWFLLDYCIVHGDVMEK